MILCRDDRVYDGLHRDDSVYNGVIQELPMFPPIIRTLYPKEGSSGSTAKKAVSKARVAQSRARPSGTFAHWFVWV